MQKPTASQSPPRRPRRGGRPRRKGVLYAPWWALAAGAVIFVLALLLIEKLGIA